MSNCIKFENDKSVLSLEDKSLEDTNKVNKYWVRYGVRYYDDLGGALREDWEYFVKYVKMNKAMVFWLFVCLLIIQEYDIISIGRFMHQVGGVTTPNQLKTTLNNLKPKEGEKPSSSEASKSAESKSKTAKEEYIDKKKESLSKFGSKISESKLVKGFKGPSAVSWGKMFDMFKKAFYIIGVILAVIGVLSLPILIILTLTYFTIRYLVRKITNL